MALVLALLPLLLMICALIDIITRVEDQVLHLPRLLWILIVVLLPLVGSILWFAIGRDYGGPRPPAARPSPAQHSGSAMSASVHSRTQQASAPVAPQRTLSTEEQLEALDREIEYYQAQEKIKKLEAEIDKRRHDPEKGIDSSGGDPSALK